MILFFFWGGGGGLLSLILKELYRVSLFHTEHTRAACDVNCYRRRPPGGRNLICLCKVKRSLSHKDAIVAAAAAAAAAGGWWGWGGLTACACVSLSVPHTSRISRVFPHTRAGFSGQCFPCLFVNVPHTKGVKQRVFCAPDLRMKAAIVEP